MNQMITHPCFPEEDESCLTCLCHCVEATLCTACYASTLKTNADKIKEKEKGVQQELQPLRERFAREMQEARRDQKSQEELLAIYLNQEQQEREELEKLRQQIFDPTVDDAELNCCDCCYFCTAGSATYLICTPFGFCFVVDDWVDKNLRGSVGMQGMLGRNDASFFVVECIMKKKPFNNCRDFEVVDTLSSCFGLLTVATTFLSTSWLCHPFLSLAQIGRQMSRRKQFYGGICGGLCRKYHREGGNLSCCYCRYFLCPDCSTLPRKSVSVAFENRRIVFLVRQLGNGSTNTAMQIYNVMYLTAKYIDITNFTGAPSRSIVVME